MTNQPSEHEIPPVLWAGVNDWRRAAFLEILWTGSRVDGPNSQQFCAALMRHLPGLSVRIFTEDRASATATLKELLADWETVVAPAIRHEVVRSNDAFPAFGWWRGRYDSGAEIEVILVPGGIGISRGTFVVAGANPTTVEALVLAALDGIHRRRDRYQRYAGTWTDAPEMQAEVAKLGWGDIVLPAETLADIRRSVELFFDRRHVFGELGFPWRRGLLFVGPPGTGKTMLCKAIAAAHPDVPFLYVEDVGRSRQAREEIAAIFHRARRSAPCILAFEDIDGLVTESSRAVFLNELDGFSNNDGLLIVASSNHPERIDEALLKRPSRFDRVYHIGLPALAEREEYCRRLLGRLPTVSPTLDTAGLSARVARMTEGFTPAFLKEAFLSAALQTAQEGRAILDDAFGAAVLEQVEILRTYLKKAGNPTAMAELTGAGQGSIGFRRPSRAEPDLDEET